MSKKTPTLYDPGNQTITKGETTHNLTMGVYDENWEFGCPLSRFYADALLAYKEDEMTLQQTFDLLMALTAQYALSKK